MNLNYNIKLVYSNLSNAMIRNVNNNFHSISFDYLTNEEIQVKVILYDYNKYEKDLIDDLMAELSALAEENTILSPIVTTDLTEFKLSYNVYESVN